MIAVAAADAKTTSNSGMMSETVKFQTDLKDIFDPYDKSDITKSDS